MSAQTYKVVRVHRYGGPEELVIEEATLPVPQAGEVLIRVHAAGVLPSDWKIRQGLLPSSRRQLPYTPGAAVAGIVAAVGPDVTAFTPGQAVFGRSPNGAYAEYVTAPVAGLVLKPDALSFDLAATIIGGATTAWEALFDKGGLQAGQRVLIHGGAGGVGLFAVQFARWKGAHVISTASTKNVDFVRDLGAETVVDYSTTRFEDIVQDVDLVFDTVGGETLERSFGVLKRGGMLISIVGQPSAEQAEAHGVQATFFSGTTTNEELETIAQLIAEGQVKAVISKTFALAEVREAHELSQHGHGQGRIVLHIAD